MFTKVGALFGCPIFELTNLALIGSLPYLLLLFCDYVPDSLSFVLMYLLIHLFTFFNCVCRWLSLSQDIKINTDEQKSFKYATEDLIIKKKPWSERWNKWPGSCCCCFLTGSCQSLPSVSPRIVSYPTRRRWAELFSPGWTRDISPNQLYLCCFRKWLYWENK